jgi:heme exporter protein A
MNAAVAAIGANPVVGASRAFPGLSARGLSLSRGSRRLFDDLSFALHAGELLRLSGPNGSGKSSLLRALLGLVPLGAGTLTLGSQPVSPREICREALYQGHAPASKAELSALENLALAAALDGAPTALPSLIGALDRVGLSRHRTIEARRLSQGQRQRLQLARFALACPRRLWLMDEPSAALDTEGAALLESLLSTHLAEGGAAIVATHLPVGDGLGASGAVRELRLAASGALR